uniref:probable G-protein coupled receptor 45 n=1 Tax=Myxine glutinosa TaxID=7769 RepID=UPI00358F700E
MIDATYDEICGLGNSSDVVARMAAGRPSFSLQIVLTLLLVPTIALGILGNLVVCLIVYRKPAMRSAINLLLATLAFADLLLCVTCAILDLISLVAAAWLFGALTCRISAALFALFAIEAVTILLIISIDRFLIIARRQDRLTPRKAKVIIVASWAAALALALPAVLGWPGIEVPPRAPQCVLAPAASFLGQSYAGLVATAVFFAPFAAMLYAYLGIFNTVRRNAVRVHDHPAGLCLSQAGKLSLTGLQTLARLNAEVSFKTRAFATVLLLFAVYVLCFMPYAIFSLMAAFNLTFYCGSNFYVTSAWVLWLAYLKSALNPIIYYWRIGKFRHACDELVPSFLCAIPVNLWPGCARVRPSTVYVCTDNHSAL